MSTMEETRVESRFLMVGDHLALDILNTVARIDGQLIDFLESDQDVLDWLKGAGWPVESDPAKLRPRSILQAARNLRDSIRTLVERRKVGKRIDPAELNAFLRDARSHLELESTKDGEPKLRRRWKQRSAEEMLAPLAESAADLLVNGDFELIRRCESDVCVLWFYDRTKSHHRRWCSMATCGNRHKVAEYRKRRRAAI